MEHSRARSSLPNDKWTETNLPNGLSRPNHFRCNSSRSQGLPRGLAGLSTLDRCDFRVFLSAIGCIARCETLVGVRAAVCFADRSFHRDMRSQSDDIRQFYKGLVTDQCRTVLSSRRSSCRSASVPSTEVPNLVSPICLGPPDRRAPPPRLSDPENKLRMHG
jgi:hypothetical protein